MLKYYGLGAFKEGAERLPLYVLSVVKQRRQQNHKT